MAKVTLENQTKNDWLFPVMKTKTKKVLRHVLIEGGLVETETEEEVRYRADNVHLPPTLNRREPGEVEVDEDVYLALCETTNLEDLIESRDIRVHE